MADQIFDQQEPGAAAQNEANIAAAWPGPEILPADLRQRIADRHAAHINHPHTQLQELQKQLQDPTIVDINARIALHHGILARLIQTILSHTPTPGAL